MASILRIEYYGGGGVFSSFFFLFFLFLSINREEMILFFPSSLLIVMHRITTIKNDTVHLGILQHVAFFCQRSGLDVE